VRPAAAGEGDDAVLHPPIRHLAILAGEPSAREVLTIKHRCKFFPGKQETAQDTKREQKKARFNGAGVTPPPRTGNLRACFCLCKRETGSFIRPRRCSHRAADNEP
jgi:hypothetical protein